MTHQTATGQVGHLFDNEASPNHLIDNVATYPTPEGLVLTLMPAGLMPRISAWLMDGLIKAVAFTMISIVGAFFGEAGLGFIAIGFFLINWLYPVYFEVNREGMTPGKKSQHIYVCHDDGTPITLQASLIRNLLRVADFLPLFYASGAISMLFNSKSQRIGDIVAGTIVVYRNKDTDEVAKLFYRVTGTVSRYANPNGSNPTTSANLNSTNSFNGNPNQTTLSQTATANMAHPNMPHSNVALFFYPLTLSEQQALLAFGERAPFLSEARQLEIANALLPLLGDDVKKQQSQRNFQGQSHTNEQILQMLAIRINNIQGYNPQSDDLTLNMLDGDHNKQQPPSNIPKYPSSNGTSL